MLRSFLTFNLLGSMLPTVFGRFEDRQWLYFGEADLIGQQNGTCENVVVLASQKFPLPFSPNLTSTCTSSGGPIRLIFGEDVWSGERVSNISVRFDCDSSFSLLRNYSLIYQDGDTMPGNTSASIACDLIDSLRTNTTHGPTPPLHSSGSAEVHASAGQDSAAIASPSQRESATSAGQGLDLSDDEVPQTESESRGTASTSGQGIMPTGSKTNNPQEDNTITGPALGGTSTNISEDQQRPRSGMSSPEAVPSRTGQADPSAATSGRFSADPSGNASLIPSRSQALQDPSYEMTASHPENALPTQNDTCTCRSD